MKTKQPPPVAGESLKIKCLLLQQAALDPPNITVRIGGEANVKSISPHESGAFVLTESGRTYIIPWTNIRHAEVE